MKGLVLKAKNFESLQLDEVTDPIPGHAEVLVKIKAAALNHRDVWIMQGLYAKIKLPVILGSDGSGVVEEVGEGVDKGWLKKSVLINPALDWGGDVRAQQKDFRILGMPDDGTQAEYVIVPVSNLYEKPAHLNFENAAALPLAGLTGYRALFTKGQLIENETLLITGIGGGVAGLVMQMALAAGSKVYVTSGSDHKIKAAIDQGAINGVNYRKDGWPSELSRMNENDGFDIVVDSAGGPGFQHLLDLVKPGGRIVVFGATAGTPGDLNLRKIFWNQVTVLGTTMGHPEDFRHMLEFVTRNQIEPFVHKVYSFSEYKTAYQDMMVTKQFGKIVLKVAD